MDVDRRWIYDIVENPDGAISINLKPEKNILIGQLLGEIESFILGARDNGTRSFEEIYHRICSRENKIALRKELVPIYLAVVLQKY